MVWSECNFETSLAVKARVHPEPKVYNRIERDTKIWTDCTKINRNRAHRTMEFSSHTVEETKTRRLSNLKIEIKEMSNGVRLAQPVFHDALSLLLLSTSLERSHASFSVGFKRKICKNTCTDKDIIHIQREL